MRLVYKYILQKNNLHSDTHKNTFLERKASDSHQKDSCQATLDPPGTGFQKEAQVWVLEVPVFLSWSQSKESGGPAEQWWSQTAKMKWGIVDLQTWPDSFSGKKYKRTPPVELG